MSEKPNWQFLGAVIDGGPFIIGGLDVWKYQWKDTKEHAEVEDPHYHQKFRFQIYEIPSESRVIRFAAGEFSNCIWGFYKED